MLVGSVIAMDSGAPAGDVLGAATRIVTAEAGIPRSSAQRSLFECELGEGPVLTVREGPVQTAHPDRREEHFVCIMPAWDATSDIDLDRAELGFPAIERALAAALGLSSFDAEARQAAVARYSAVGFEAAAVTGMAMATSRPRYVDGLRRTATVRYGHPFAVVAACTERSSGQTDAVASPWAGLPVFSAWVSEPSEANPSHRSDG